MSYVDCLVLSEISFMYGNSYSRNTYSRKYSRQYFLFYGVLPSFAFNTVSTTFSCVYKTYANWFRDVGGENWLCMLPSKTAHKWFDNIQVRWFVWPGQMLMFFFCSNCPGFEVRLWLNLLCILELVIKVLAAAALSWMSVLWWKRVLKVNIEV